MFVGDPLTFSDSLENKGIIAQETTRSRAKLIIPIELVRIKFDRFLFPLNAGDFQYLEQRKPILIYSIGIVDYTNL